MYKPRHEFGIPSTEVDYVLLWSSVFLLAIGLVFVYSASIATAEVSRATHFQPTYFLIRQGVFILIGCTGAALVFQIPSNLWQQHASKLFVLGTILLAIVLIPGIGHHVTGARRWLSLGFVNIQPSELMKLAAVMYAADYTVRKIHIMHDLVRAFLPMFFAMSIVGSLLLLEPDFGALVVIVTIAMGILFLGGLRARLFVILVIGLVVIFVLMITYSEYRRQRVLGFMNPWEKSLTSGYQLSHSLIAFGRGELFGVGLGASVEKLFYLPEAHTDFLLAIIAEELGLSGLLVVIVLFGLVVERALTIGRRCVQLDRLYPALVAMGIGIWIGVQSFFNMGVNMGLLPTKGLTLPLMSFGGSGIVMNCIAIGMLLRIDWENRNLMGRRL